MSKGSKYPGVWKDGEKWSAIIDIDNEQLFLGTFKMEEHAAIAYLMAKAESKLEKQ